jgi:hypothetical protein
MDMKIAIDWIIGNILWEVLLLVILVFIPSVIKIIRFSRKILSQNRDTRGGNGWGIHYADRFIDVWYSEEKTPLRQSTEMYKMNNNPNSRHWIKFIDEQLQKWGLVKLSTNADGNIVKPIRNWKNRIILFIVETWLVYVAGDNKNFYKELKKRMKKS